MTTAADPNEAATLSLHITTFKNAAATEKRESAWTWQQLVAFLIAAKTYPSKDACPWIKLARFGDVRSDKNSLRHDSNVLAIYGIEGDYDGMQVSVADGATLIADAGVEAFIYTSPRHTPDKPRWRVLCPLSQELPSGRRAALVGRLNGVLGGILARESFTLSQSYYYGRVDGVVYEVQQVRGGRFIDQCDGLSEVMAHQVPGAVMPAHEDDATREEHIIEGHEGQVYPALRDLAAAHASRGMAEADSIAHLFGLLERCRWRGLDPRTWQDRHDEVVGFVQSARPFRPNINDDTFVLPAGEGPTVPDDLARMTMIDDIWGDPRNETAVVVGWPLAVDFAALAERQPEPPRFVIPDWLPEGYAILLAGHGGIGKSGIALHMSVCIALGRRFWGVDCAPRRVLYLSCEDRESLLHWRLSRICAHEGISLADLAGKLELIDLVGTETTLWLPEVARGTNSSAITMAYAELYERIEATQRQVIVVDGISDTFGGNENDRMQVKRFVNALLRPMPVDGSLLLLGHVSKPAATASATSEGYSGSTQWHNAVRARWYLYPEMQEGDDGEHPQRTGKLILEVQKANLSRDDQTLIFEWDDDKHLYAAVGGSGRSGDLVSGIEARRDERAILRALAAAEDAGEPVHSGERANRTASKRLAAEGTLPDSFRGRAKRGKLNALLIRLKSDGLLTEATRWSAARNPVAVWLVTARGRADCGAGPAPETHREHQPGNAHDAGVDADDAHEQAPS